ncbi:hypothetical protein Moror_802 [Moniliophthora roreri MCA 2997]|uniref:HECT-type E3 ubiquitin transferase n=1 Tax=Moniliophthora roreri (strain MCA 2997) TaxID=1381753 RepID=V2X808_MONRO|nr:hypothetical protein Moror_802 [Moniliophthora roreri MCA 2997]
MLPFLDDPSNKRTINLSGQSTSTSHQSILEQAKQRRNERIEHKRRTDAAIQIQGWYRGRKEARRVREVLAGEIVDGRLDLETLRKLILVRGEVVARWAEKVDVESIRRQVKEGGEGTSWIVCMRQIGVLLLQHSTIAGMQIIQTLLDNTQCLNYLVNHGFYASIARLIISSSKNSPQLSILIQLATHPPLSPQIISDIVSHILTIPLLPNRLPLPSLTHLSARLPLAQLHLLPSSPTSALTPAQKIDLVANLLAFTPPRYQKLPPQAFAAYLCLLADLMDLLPINALEPSSPSNTSTSATNNDSDDDNIRVTVVDSFTPIPIPIPTLPPLDPKTLKRLQTLPSNTHIHSILDVSKSPSTKYPLVRFILALVGIYPSKTETILNIIWSHPSGIVKDLWRTWVRSSGLGRDIPPDGDALTPRHSSGSENPWPPLILLSSLYTSALVTMGDDEFFSLPGTPARNPLSIDEIASFSRMLINIAWTLYMHSPPSTPSTPTQRFGWSDIREQVTRTLVSIHARDARRGFMGDDGWLVFRSSSTGGEIWQSFLEAAVAEEQALISEDSMGGDMLDEDPIVVRPSPRFIMRSGGGVTPRSSSTRRLVGYRREEFLGPRQAVLNNIPFVIPFEVRVAIFRQYVLVDRQRHAVASSRYPRRPRVEIRRTHIAQDGFDKLNQDVDLKKGVEIVFMDRWGEEEAGIDGGGVFKEFLTSLSKEVFDTDRGLWQVNRERELYPATGSLAIETHSLNWYRFIGRILGKAMYDGILVDVAFANFFLGKWLSRTHTSLDDLASLDPDLYNGLVFLKHYPKEKVEDLSLTFVIGVEEYGLQQTIPLIPNGASIPVTASNRLQYITLVSHFKLSKQIKKQSEAFWQGVSDLVQARWVRMFNPHELQILLGGVNTPIDIEDLRNNTNYGGVYDEREQTVGMFWDVVNSFSEDQKRALLRFVTSCSRPPLLGFKELNPHFAIRDAGNDQHRLPTSSTCVNLLKLPKYQDKQTLRAKLVQAINAGAGFDLS